MPHTIPQHIVQDVVHVCYTAKISSVQQKGIKKSFVVTITLSVWDYVKKQHRNLDKINPQKCEHFLKLFGTSKPRFKRLYLLCPYVLQFPGAQSGTECLLHYLATLLILCGGASQLLCAKNGNNLGRSPQRLTLWSLCWPSWSNKCYSNVTVG